MVKVRFFLLFHPVCRQKLQSRLFSNKSARPDGIFQRICLRRILLRLHQHIALVARILQNFENRVKINAAVAGYREGAEADAVQKA